MSPFALSAMFVLLLLGSIVPQAVRAWREGPARLAWLHAGITAAALLAGVGKIYQFHLPSISKMLVTMIP
ncbi:hypothetical protein [Paenibacillus methanolicus]|uniref:Uncharacterized protein n=1 Tax=Paenibacillus methanolicus TaxID=582686 RepID=A0A5S5CI98_9BACL|nr:hypothetical protein [Paenibacillus methanolicus]TYP79254.1 hypothetical protein BCM02_101372 [Paenibacillus methanolicus]